MLRADKAAAAGDSSYEGKLDGRLQSTDPLQVPIVLLESKDAQLSRLHSLNL